MPLYALGDRHPTLPPEGHYWIAPERNPDRRRQARPRCGVWFGAVLRGDNEPIVVGPARTSRSTAYCTPTWAIRSRSARTARSATTPILHGCTVGDGSLIGMGAVVLNGARIGRGCLVGARALVTEGKSFPDHSLIVGSPAKAIRDARRRRDAVPFAAPPRHYVENWRRYLAAIEADRRRVSDGVRVLGQATFGASQKGDIPRPRLALWAEKPPPARRAGIRPASGALRRDRARSPYQRGRARANEAEPMRRRVSGEGAKDAGMGRAMVPKRQQSDLDMKRAQP